MTAQHIADRLAGIVLDYVEREGNLSRSGLATALRRDLLDIEASGDIERYSLIFIDSPQVEPAPKPGFTAGSVNVVDVPAGTLIGDEYGAIVPSKLYGSIKREFAHADPEGAFAVGGPFDGSHRNYRELTEGFLGGHYEINLGIKTAVWISRT